MSPDPQQTVDQCAPTVMGQSTDPNTTDPYATRAPDSTDPFATRIPTPEEAAAERSATTAVARELPNIPGHENLTEIGRGGMGIVYQATQITLNRVVAIKMILAGQHAGHEVLERFRTEAEAVARLRHPNIVQIYHIDYYQTAAGTTCPYMILEYADSGSLERKLAGKPMDPRSAAELVEILARAMAVAHAEGVVHRDLKPANILLQSADRSGARLTPTTSALARAIAKLESESAPSIAPLDRSFRFAGVVPKIGDFGLAKQEGSDLTASGAIMGTPSYMSPEQASGQKNLGPPTDIYALGAILYECLTGRPPFLGATPLATLDMVRHQEPVPPRSLQASVPRDLDTICLKALQKKPKDRYASAQALADDLRRFLQGEPISTRPPSVIEKAIRWGRKHPLRVTLLAASVLLAVAIVVIVIQRQRMAQQDEVNAAVSLGMNGLIETFDVATSGDLREPKDRQQLYDTLKNSYRQLLASEGLYDPVTRGEGYYRLGNMCRRTDDAPGAQEAFRQARSLLTAALASMSGNITGRQILARTHKELGALAMENGKYDEAGSAFQEAEKISTALYEADPASLPDADALAEVFHQLGELSGSQGKPEQATRLYGQAIQIRRGLVDRASQPQLREYRHNLARDYGYLGDAERLLGRVTDAEASYRASLKLRQQQVDELSSDKNARFQLARGHENMGNLYAMQDRGGESIEAFRSARRLLIDLHDENPGYKEYQADLARIDNRLALMLADQGQSAEIVQLLEESRKLFKPLVKKEPGAIFLRGGLSWALAQEARYAEPAKRVALLTEASEILCELESCRESAEDGYVGAVTYLLQAQDSPTDADALKAKARDRLQMALRRGFSYLPQLRRDPLFRELLAENAVASELIRRAAK